jgi:hypothetical protein
MSDKIKTYSRNQLYLGYRVRKEHPTCCDDFPDDCPIRHIPNPLPVPSGNIPPYPDLPTNTNCPSLGLVAYSKSKATSDIVYIYNGSSNQNPMQVAELSKLQLKNVQEKRSYRINTKVYMSFSSLSGTSPELLIYTSDFEGCDGEEMDLTDNDNTLIDKTVGTINTGSGDTGIYTTFTSSRLVNGELIKDKFIKFAIKNQAGVVGDKITVVLETETNFVRNNIYVEDTGCYVSNLD